MYSMSSASIPPFDDVHRRRRAMQPRDDDHVANRRRSLQRFVGHLLQRDHLATTPATIRGDEQRALRVVDAIA
jgi:hypothetical protein